MSKESYASQHSIYEKELRKAQKEAMKSSSMIVKLQTDLNANVKSMKAVRSNLDLEKQKVQQKEQERFEMEYQLIPLQEQIERLTQQLRTAESQNELLKASLKDGEVAQVAAGGMIALPTSQDHDTNLLSSGQERSWSSPFNDKENVPTIPKKGGESKRSTEELEREKARRRQAEELVEFLRMECLFRCCPCQNAVRLGHDLALSLDAELAAGVERIRQDMGAILTPPKSPAEADPIEAGRGVMSGVVDEKGVEAQVEGVEDEATMLRASGTMTNDDLDRSTTMPAEDPDSNASPDDQLCEKAERALHIASPTPTQNLNEEQSAESPLPVSHPSTSLVTPSRQDHQSTPFRAQPSIRTVTTTTTVPMHFTPVTKPQLFSEAINRENIENQPPQDNPAVGGVAVPTTPTFDRAAALAAIEYRRGRAKSIANGQGTPRKQMIEGVNQRRDISAPALGQKGVGSVKTRSGSAGRTVGRRT